MDARAAKRYAQALFNTATKHSMVQAVEDDLAALTGLLVNDAQFRHYLLSPNVPREDRLRIAEKLFSDRITALTMQALRLMITKRREREIEGVHEEFVRLRRVQEKAMRVVVTSAAELSPAERDSLVAKLAAKSGKKIEPTFETDAALLGGVKVAYGDYVLDGSVKGSFNRLKSTLLYDVLKQS